MKQIDNYILEKLHINKDSKAPNPYRNVEFVKAIRDFMMEYFKTNRRLTAFTVNEEGDDKIIIETNSDFRIYYPELKKYILDKFDDFYKINSITWELAKCKIIIKYEK